MARLVRDLLARAWHDRRGERLPIGPDQILTVTPYNAQIRAIRDALARASNLRAAAIAVPGRDGVRVDAGGLHRGEFSAESFGVGGGEHSGLVEVGQVADLVGDVPAGARAWACASRSR